PDALLIASGPLLVPFPKEVVSSNGIPKNTMLDSLNEVFVSMSPKEQPALVLSGVIKKESKRSKIFVNLPK
ncbi:MAG: hypothetical protein QN632_01545, partial [Nitrososphaeraceae archaeon]|nr:hypothetical protein [Nitrososphaeraceae archaeon]